MADSTALQPRARGIPHKLLPVLLYRYIKGVTDIWVIKVPHTQDLWIKNVAGNIHKYIQIKKTAKINSKNFEKVF